MMKFRRRIRMLHHVASWTLLDGAAFDISFSSGRFLAVSPGSLSAVSLGISVVGVMAGIAIVDEDAIVTFRHNCK